MPSNSAIRALLETGQAAPCIAALHDTPPRSMRIRSFDFF
ncbi:hypothetical protein BSIN_0620 [Burkholderia singularis]|uniref:Uncharacterized protein n=1 Tax=Burkholderia singularis TaxID=1503053 RepID=A0A238H8K8_9BURK|nr:hypothetical protein BSIN_0620 [Burkholderia singularis]